MYVDVHGGVRVDAVHAVLEAPRVVHDRRDRAGSTDGGNFTRLTDAGSHDAGQVAGLRLGEDDALVVR